MLVFLIFLGAFLLMECITSCTLKFVTHGFLLYLHADHHQPKYTHIFERNDFFFVIFAIPSILLFYFGVEVGINYRFFINLGIMFYGLCYFNVHDIIIHQRIKLFKNTKNKYLISLRKGHKVHHNHIGKDEGDCFGMLFVPSKYFKI
jgi:beta-carotene 3-hydroxylase